VPSSADGSRAWLALAAVLALGAVLAFVAGARVHAAIDWQPALAGRAPWRAWSAVFVHYSALHLLANLVGLALVAALGWFAPASRATAIAWALAWPLTQIGLLARPDLLHYGGLSGVLHAGVACVGWQLVVHAHGRRRAIGALVLVGLALKVARETPWGAPLREAPGWDIATAPFAHASGLVAGLLAAAVCDAVAVARARAAFGETP
jgi:rhomboid family GlyGly-CTERM serine protease